jgi:hypothetical protein
MANPAFDLSHTDRSHFENYCLDGAYYEMFEAAESPRDRYRGLHQMLLDLPLAETRRRKQAADISFLHERITFTVYGREEGTERIFPHEPVCPASESTATCRMPCEPPKVMKTRGAWEFSTSLGKAGGGPVADQGVRPASAGFRPCPTPEHYRFASTSAAWPLALTLP